MTEQFRILSAREHAITRMGMYVGSSTIEVVEQFLFGKWTKARYTPALFKMVNEILDNSIDEAIRTKFRFANKIDVSMTETTVTITDNGRGIPLEKIQTPEGEMLTRAVAAWTRVNAGTSFDDTRTTIGANGLGSAVVNFLSSSFHGQTWSNGTCFHVICSDGAKEIKTKETKKGGSGTSVTFTPDFSLFECDSFEGQHLIELVQDRLISLQMAFPEIAFSFNKKRIQIRDLKRYAGMFVQEGASIVIEKSDNLSFFFSASNDGFRANSFINGVNTRQGGTYVEHIVNNVVDELLTLIKKKHKVEVAKSVIKNGLTFVMFARNFVNPKFDSQTKERLTNPVSNIREHHESSGVHDFKYIARKIFASNDIIEPIIAAQLAKKMADERRDALVAQKKLKKVKVAKHLSASSENALLALVEGDSAMGFLLKVRDASKLGAYPLRGVIMNTWNMKASEVLKNKELSELVAILGLDINDPNSVDNMTYRGVATLTDADHDGEKIAVLLIGFFYKFWPRLITEKRVHITRSPIMISSKGDDIKWFYGYESANKFKNSDEGKKYKHRYIKGLGSLTEEEYDRVINDPVFDTIIMDSPQLIEMMLGNNSEPRKKFMLRDY